MVSTPLKLANLCKEYAFEGLEYLIIDEGDKMFELGFLEQV
jgi:superfamily II DNA/RNA helicase